MIEIVFTVPHRKMHGTVTAEMMPSSLKEALAETLEDIMGSTPSHWNATIHIVASYEPAAPDDA